MNSAAENYTDHHGVPRSFGGSSDQVNITRIEEDEHSTFHAAVGHPRPDFLIRNLMLESVKTNGRSVSPMVVRDVLNVLTSDDWRDPYVPEAYRNFSRREQVSRECAAKIASHIDEHVEAERDAIKDAMNRLTIHANCPRLSTSSRRTFLFFRSQKPLQAMDKILHESSVDGDLKWVKPLKSEVRLRLIEILKGAEIELLTQAGRKKLIQVLLDHRDALTRYSVRWEPNIYDHVLTLARMGHRKDNQEDD